jgi:hypothetical protein
MVKRILLLAGILLLVTVSIGKAQTPLELAQVRIDLWPEYDQPSMLVIYHITLPPSAVPADLTLQIPTSAGEPNAVAARQTDGSLISIVSNRLPGNDDFSEISFKATTPEIQLEYYDPGLVKNGSSRHFEYTWPGDYPVSSLVLSVQQPPSATDMRFSPGLGNPVEASDSLNYYTADVGSLKAGQTFKLSFDYNKNNDTLTSSNLKVQPSAPISDTTAGITSILTSTTFRILVGLGLLLIIGGGVWYWQSGRNKDESELRPRHKPAAERQAATSEGYVYCHQCGKRASPGDRFCRTCGAQLRTG